MVFFVLIGKKISVFFLKPKQTSLYGVLPVSAQHIYFCVITLML